LDKVSETAFNHRLGFHKDLRDYRKVQPSAMAPDGVVSDDVDDITKRKLE